ncbi:MAG: hypothetical protein JNL67_19690 [Planctomycetaceae bacterium]|nr:hypothetical protein [Planctomycetaceae bacterium]
MTEPKHVLIVFNPKAGAADRRDLLNSLQGRLGEMGLDVELVVDLENLKSRAAELGRAGKLRLVVSAGGDGTLAAVAERTSPETCLAVFPLGTENLMGKWLGASSDLVRFCAAVRANRTRVIDVATANGRLALITIGVGFDAEVVRRVHTQRRGHISKWTYAWPIWATFCSFRFPRFRVEIEGWNPVDPRSPNSLPSGVSDLEPVEARHWTAPWVFVANLPLYAGGLSLIPHALPTDGKLDVATLSGTGRIRGLFYALWIALRRHVYLRDFEAFRATAIRISADLPAGYQLDGDYGGPLPLEIQVQPHRLKLLEFA